MHNDDKEQHKFRSCPSKTKESKMVEHAVQCVKVLDCSNNGPSVPSRVTVGSIRRVSMEPEPDKREDRTVLEHPVIADHFLARKVAIGSLQSG